MHSPTSREEHGRSHQALGALCYNASSGICDALARHKQRVAQRTERFAFRPDRWLWRTGLNRRGLGCRTLETDLRPRDFFLVFRHVHMVEEIRDLADAVDEVRRTQGQRALHLQETG